MRRGTGAAGATGATGAMVREVPLMPLVRWVPLVREVPLMPVVRWVPLVRQVHLVPLWGSACGDAARVPCGVRREAIARKCGGARLPRRSARNSSVL